MKKFIDQVPDAVFYYVFGAALALYAAALVQLGYEILAIIPAVVSVAMLGHVLWDTIKNPPDPPKAA